MQLSETGQELISQYSLLHKNHKRFPGFSIKKQKHLIRALIEAYQVKTILDYGCGKGKQYTELKVHENWGDVDITLYDPGYKPYGKRPQGKFDLVICTDVMEHVAEEDVEAVISDIFQYAKYAVFFCVFTGPSKKTLPDGRNCHVTVKDEEWWRNKIHGIALLREAPLAIALEFRS